MINNRFFYYGDLLITGLHFSAEGRDLKIPAERVADGIKQIVHIGGRHIVIF